MTSSVSLRSDDVSERDEATTRAADPEPSLNPWVLFSAAFATLYAMLIFNNRFMFSTVVSEGGDSAANSIITHQAKHFELLVGNYSRLGFNHPGPAYFYIQAFGEWLFHDLLGIVPSAWNGEALAIFGLNSAFVAITLVVLSRWLKSGLLISVAGIVMLAFFAVNGALLAGIWMPYEYFAPFLLLLVAGASVATGRAADLWAVALAGSFLVHGHASFILLVPVVTVVAVALYLHHAGLRRLRRADFARLRHALREDRRHWFVAGGVIGLFLVPMVINLILHGPGQYRSYFGYGNSANAGGHPIGDAIRFATRFWPGRDGALWPNQPGPLLPATTASPLIIMVLMFSGLGAIAWWQRTQDLGRYQRNALIMGVAATGLVVVYATRGVDDLRMEYTALFSQAVPLVVLVLLVTGVVAGLQTERFRRTATALAGSLAVLMAVTAAVWAPTLRSSVEHTANVAPAIDAVRARTGGAPALLEFQDVTWPTMTALLIQGERVGQRVCVVDGAWKFMVTAEFVCGPDELRAGQKFQLKTPENTPSGATVVGEFTGAVGSNPDVSRTVLSIS